MTSILTSTPHTTRFVPNITASTERQHLKDASTQFFDRLAELESVCAQYPLSRGDPELRDRIGKEAGDLVGGAWRVFLARCLGKGVDKCESRIILPHDQC
jgi:exocyst complex protein 7